MIVARKYAAGVTVAAGAILVGCIAWSSSTSRPDATRSDLQPPMDAIVAAMNGLEFNRDRAAYQAKLDSVAIALERSLIRNASYKQTEYGAALAECNKFLNRAVFYWVAAEVKGEHEPTANKDVREAWKGAREQYERAIAAMRALK